ncbi:MAG: hypothetical protein F4X34_06285 [Chloroflexi bacterium]|nr:hypothetical protein [Chloroflexota bacterium]
MESFECPYLGMSVELTDERMTHVRSRHPGVLPEHLARIADTLEYPDVIQQSSKESDVRLFSRRFPDQLRGRHIVVVVKSDTEPALRHWIRTAYIARRLSGAVIKWQRV